MPATDHSQLRIARPGAGQTRGERHSSQRAARENGAARIAASAVAEAGCLCRQARGWIVVPQGCMSLRRSRRLAAAIAVRRIGGGFNCRAAGSDSSSSLRRSPAVDSNSARAAANSCFTSLKLAREGFDLRRRALCRTGPSRWPAGVASVAAVGVRRFARSRCSWPRLRPRATAGLGVC